MWVLARIAHEPPGEPIVASEKRAREQAGLAELHPLGTTGAKTCPRKLNPWSNPRAR